MLKQKISQKQLQKLSPQQIQLMKLLQIPTANLDQRIKEELEANPALDDSKEVEEEDEFRTESKEEEEELENKEEKVEEVSVEDYLSDDEYDDYRTQVNNYSADDEHKTIPIPVRKTFHETLNNQLGLLNLGDHEYLVAQHLIGNIDDDGYLRRSLDAMVDDLAFSQNITTSEEELKSLLEKIQKFEPAGVGAQNLSECLLLQLERYTEEHEMEERNLAIKLLSQHFDAFTKKHYDKLLKQLEVSEEQLKEAIELIQKLNPKPGGSERELGKDNHYIIPDFFIENQDGELVLTLNARNAPYLRVNNSYQHMLTDYKSDSKKKKDKKQKEAMVFIKSKIDAARWFIEAIKQRQQTMMLSMQTIMEIQYDYLISGDETALKPMILKDIAEITGLDISTISRVANSKYVQTEFGTKLLKAFFSESLQTQSGEEVSTREVKKILSNVIEEENKKKPLSDQKLTEILKEKGYNIARRTVAKYREQLNIPVARLRKEL